MTDGPSRTVVVGAMDHPAPADDGAEHGDGGAAERPADSGAARAGQGARDEGAAGTPEADAAGRTSDGNWSKTSPWPPAWMHPIFRETGRGGGMKLVFLDLAPDERRLYIEQAALRRNLSPVVLEKDFWMCWLLGVLFRSEFAGSLVFKGGTSLSKVFGVIGPLLGRHRPVAVAGIPGPPRRRGRAGPRRTSGWRRPKAGMRGRRTRSDRARIGSCGGGRARKKEGAWFEFLTDQATHSPVLLFHYPSTQPAGFEYLKRSVCETGVRLADGPAAGRPATRCGRGWPDALPEAILRLGVRSRGPGGRAQFLGEGDHSTHRVPPAGREADPRPVFPPLRGHGGVGPAPRRDEGRRSSRPAGHRTTRDTPHPRGEGRRWRPMPRPPPRRTRGRVDGPAVSRLSGLGGHRESDLTEIGFPIAAARLR